MNIKIAAVSDDGQTISQHFGRAKYNTVLTIEDGKIIAREQREKLGHAHFAGEEHTEEKDPRGHGFAPAEQDRHFRMAEAIRDCKFLLARGMGSGAYYSMEQVGIKPIITNIASIDEAGLEAAQGIIVDHKEKLH
jgi:predicted Fe-Mo cluster-binding NifX family protein